MSANETFWAEIDWLNMPTGEIIDFLRESGADPSIIQAMVNANAAEDPGGTIDQGDDAPVSATLTERGQSLSDASVHRNNAVSHLQPEHDDELSDPPSSVGRDNHVHDRPPPRVPDQHPLRAATNSPLSPPRALLPAQSRIPAFTEVAETAPSTGRHVLPNAATVRRPDATRGFEPDPKRPKTTKENVSSKPRLPAKAKQSKRGAAKGKGKEHARTTPMAVKAEPADGAVGGTAPRHMWSQIELGQLLEGVLSADGVLGGHLHTIPTPTISDWMWARVSEQVFDNNISAAACKSKFSHLKAEYTAIKELEAFTGGNGDADLSDDMALHNQITLATRASTNIKNLTVQRYREFQNEGWYDLFNVIFGAHPGIVPKVIYRSGALSDDNVIDVDNLSSPLASPTIRSARPLPSPPVQASSSRSAATAAKTPTRPVPLHRQPGVPIPAHKPRSTSKAKDRDTTFLEFLTDSRESLKNSDMHALRRIVMVEKRDAREQAKERYAAAREILQDPQATEEIKVDARNVISLYLRGQL